MHNFILLSLLNDGLVGDWILGWQSSSFSSLFSCTHFGGWENSVNGFFLPSNFNILFKIFSLSAMLYWRRKCQPTSVFLPGESQGWRSLVGCHLWVAQSWTWLKRLSSSSSIQVIFLFSMYIFLIYPDFTEHF